jgi:hypothetical protein
MPARHARRVEVADDIDIPLDVTDEIAFHDLHVVTVEQHVSYHSPPKLNSVLNTLSDRILWLKSEFFSLATRCKSKPLLCGLR